MGGDGVCICSVRGAAVTTFVIFAHDEREGRSVYETVDGLWRGATTEHEITPPDVVYYNGKLFSLSNRRLAALKMYQALYKKRWRVQGQSPARLLQ